MSEVTLVQAMHSQALFGPFFEGDSWHNWELFLQSFQGLPIAEEDLPLLERFTGRTKPVTRQMSEGYALVGRRGGKSKIAALMACWACVCGGFDQAKMKGETGWVFVVSVDRAQSQVIFQYVKSMLAGIPDLITRETADELYLSNGTAIRIATGSWRGIRGRQLLACIIDEACFLRSEDDPRWTAAPLEELITAIRPSIVRSGFLLAISTRYSQRGLMFQEWKRHWASNHGRTLIWSASTLDMNGTFDSEKISDDMERDPVRYATEYGTAWREDLASLLSAKDALAVMTLESALPMPGRAYTIFADMSGGRSDSAALCICHRERDKILMDDFLEVEAPFNPSEVVETFAEIAKLFSTRTIFADRYAAEWATESFRKVGIELRPSLLPKSGLFLNFASLVKAGKVALINSERLLNQLTALDRRTGQGGKDVVEKIPGSRDDVANVTAGAVVTCHLEQTTWSAEEMNARLPQKSEHRADKYLSPPIREARRREEQNLSNEELMRDFIAGDGHASRVGGATPRRWWER